MTWNFACILAPFRTGQIMVTVCHFYLVKQAKFSGDRIYREWPEIVHADVSWQPSELIWLWSRFGDFSNLGVILTLWNGSNFWFRGISWRTHGRNGLKFCLLMYPEHLQNWLNLGHGLLIFLLLASLWHSETGRIWGFRAFPRELIEGMAKSFECWSILITFRTD